MVGASRPAMIEYCLQRAGKVILDGVVDPVLFATKQISLVSNFLLALAALRF